MAKLRYQIGSFVFDQKNKQLYCVMFAFQIKKLPNEWLYYLEERLNYQSPETALSAEIKSLVGSGSIGPAQRINYKPFKSSYDAVQEMSRGMYHHGNSRTVRTKILLNEFVLLSSGEIS